MHESRRMWPSVAVLTMLAVLGSSRAVAEEFGLRVPAGFRVTLYADELLANDIYAMTLDARGRVAVTGQGYIKVLHDTKGAGKADDATLFAATATGGMGMCFDGDDLLFCGDGWLSRYHDRDGDGRADGPPTRIVPLRFAEHGGHAMRKGPDGSWYVIGGNDAGIGRLHAAAPGSPIREPEAGGLLRLTPEGGSCEVIAQGFRNPYDFDFNGLGDLFTYDSDVERDYFLPWYSPTRIYHVAYAGHHGWRLTGFLRSWARRDDYTDTVDILGPIGRGSPTGVVCYRHDQFPEHYRGGVFALDWTFGKVWFLPLAPDGASYRTRPEVFLEPTGTNGFAPTDAVIAPDGTLLISIGGRGTRGAVYRIQYVGEGKTSIPSQPAPASDLEIVLRAPQPLDAWSRARWVPLALRLGRDEFAAAVTDPKEPPEARVRAIEVLTELFGGLSRGTARAGASASASSVRARVAWSLGRRPCLDVGSVLGLLAQDREPRVRLAALESLADRLADVPVDRARELAIANLGQADKRVRQAASRLASSLPQEAWARLWADLPRTTPQARLSGALAALWRDASPSSTNPSIDLTLAAVAESADPDLRLQAVRIFMMALGDYHLQDPPVEVETGYSLSRSLRGQEETVARVIRCVRPGFPSGHARLDAETGRLLAMLEDDDPGLLSKVAAFWTKDSSPTQDMHELVVFSRLRGPRSEELTPKVADAMLALHRKLRGQEQRNKQVWGDRLAEVAANLTRRDPRLADALLSHPEFVSPGHVAVAMGLDEEHRLRAARSFLAAVRDQPDFPWTGPLVDLLAALPPEQVRPILRDQWGNLGLRDAILLTLAKGPEPTDRERFLDGLESSQPQVIQSCLHALGELPADPSPERLVPVLRLLRRLLSEPREDATRARVIALISRQSGHAFPAPPQSARTTAELRGGLRPYFAWFEREYPALSDALEGGGAGDLTGWLKRMQKVDWSKGEATRGEALFRARACQTCHAGASRTGPDLTGVAGRFSREDLLTAIVAPSREVAPPYRITVIDSRDGNLYSGIPVFESADGVILQTGATTTLRIAAEDIVARQPSQRSLMPDGLLKDLEPADLADLYRYLQSLTPSSGGTGR